MSNETLDLDAIEARGDGAWDIAVLVAEVRRLWAENERHIQHWGDGVVDRDNLRAERDRAVAALRRVEELAEKWRYKGEFGWGAWQEGYGPDQEGYVLDGAASELRAAIKGEDELQTGYSDSDTQLAASMATRAFTAEAALAAVRELRDTWHTWPGPGRAPVPWVAFFGHLDRALADQKET
jgi:hypothetical protein